MALHIVRFGEYLSMSPVDLRTEIRAHEALVRKMRLGIELNKEKDTAKYRRERKALARMKAALAQLPEAPKTQKPELKKSAKARTVPAPSKK